MSPWRHKTSRTLPLLKTGSLLTPVWYVVCIWWSVVIGSYSQTVTFDFDSGTPALVAGNSAPLDQVVGGVTAHIASKVGGFSVQNGTTAHYSVSTFTNNFLYPIAGGGAFSTLDISFSELVTNVAFDFATIQNLAVIDLETPVQLAAFNCSPTITTTVGSTNVAGVYGGPNGTDTLAVGKLNYSAKVPFNLVHISVPIIVPAPATGQAYQFLLDNLSVKRAGGSNCVITVNLPTNGVGMVTGAGAYSSGLTATLVASPAVLGCTFNSWQENGVVVSSNSVFTLTAITNRTLTAVFNTNATTFRISISRNLTLGGYGGTTVPAPGNLNILSASNMTVKAIAVSGYSFKNWVLGTNVASATNVVSTTTNYTFTVSSNLTLLANFYKLPTITLTSSRSPAGYLDVIVLTNALPVDATGSAVLSLPNGSIVTNLLFGNNTFTLTTGSLSRGTNRITCVYSGDNNYVGQTNFLEEVITNHPPNAGDAVFAITQGMSLKIPLVNLYSNVTDVDGDGFVLQSLGGSQSGATVWADQQMIYYVPSQSSFTNSLDSIRYTVSDGFGGTASANLQIYYLKSYGAGLISLPTNGVVTIRFFGIPNYTYVVQTTTSIGGPWWNLSTNTAGSNGSWWFTDVNATNAQQYYRCASL